MGCTIMNTPKHTMTERLARLPGVSRVLAMSPSHGRLVVLMLAAIMTVALLALSGARGQLTSLEERLGSLAWTLAPETDTEQRLVIVAIDEQSVAEVGAWPWSRDTMAELTRRIDAAGAQLQIHDIVYAEAKNGDAQLVSALANSRGAVIAQVPVLDVNQAPGLAPETVRAGQMTNALSGINCSANAGLMSSASYLAPHAGFAGISKGHIAPVVNSDGSIGKQPAVVCVDGQPYPALALSALLEATGTGIDATTVTAELSRDTGFFGPAQKLTLDAYPGLALPLDEQGNLRVSYRRAPESYLAVPAADVLAGRVDPELFANAWVLVGATAFGLGDIVPTPYSGATPGVELQARILGSLLDVAVPYAPRNATLVLGFVALLFAALLLRAADKASDTARHRKLNSLVLPFAAIALPLVALALHAQFLRGANIWLGWMLPALFALLGGAMLFVLEQARTRSQRDRVFNNLASYLPSEIAQEIAYSLPTSSIKADRREFTVLSADLRNFSMFGEMRPPEESAAVLHYFFQKATEIIEAHGGELHEYKGDSLLAVWPEQSAHSAEQALKAAQQMVAEIDHVSLQANSPYGLEPLALGVGIEQGAALIGSIGPAHRRTHTLLGETVTIALRIQEMTAELAQPILIGECAARQLDKETLQSQGSYLLDGLTIPHVLFAPQPEQSDEQSLTDILQAREMSGEGLPKLRVLSGGRRS